MAGNNREAHISGLPHVNLTIRMMIGDPLSEAEYESIERLLAAYQSHAYGKGYVVVLNAKNKIEENQRII
ncbi:hypothetical protein K3495_g7244 [Podosphaera aphanis]|nr:hypothetical protein K3495_g7244 [Podosphaera aphanis]